MNIAPMNKKRAHLPAILPIPAIVGAIVSVQGGAALAKGLFPALGATGTVGLRVGISAVILLAAFRPRLRRASAAQWRVRVPFRVGLGGGGVGVFLAVFCVPRRPRGAVGGAWAVSGVVWGSQRPPRAV